MSEKNVKLKRTESLLKELVSEAISSLNDENIKTLTVTEVNCSRGKYDATVFLDKAGLADDEQKKALKGLRNAKGFIKSHCLASSGWYKCPDFSFEFDNDAERMNRVEELFKKISSSKKEQKDES
jgi:ribosome-binding factor A